MWTGDNQQSLYIDSVLFLFYTVFIVLWFINNYCINRQFMSSLHKFMTFAICFKIFYNLSQVIQLFFLDGTRTEYLDLTISSSYTLYNTFFYTSLILISKGYQVTRNDLNRNQVTVLAIMMGVIYLGFSVFIIDPNQLLPLVVVLLLGMFFLIVKYTWQLIKHLNRRLQILFQINEPAVIRATKRKLDLLKLFLGIIFFYFIEQILTIVAFLLIVPQDFVQRSTVYQIEGIWQGITELICLISIYFLFRAKAQGEFFDMEDFFMEEFETVPFFLASTVRSLSDERGIVSVMVPPSEIEQPKHLFLLVPLNRSRDENFENPLQMPLLSEI